MQGSHIKQCTTQLMRRSYMTSHNGQMDIFDSLYEIEDTSTVSREDFLAKAFQLLGNEEDLPIHEVLYSLKSCVSPISSDHAIYSLKTSKDSSTTMAELHSRPSSTPWMSSGMLRYGKCLTLKISEYHKTENGCSLSDILEDQVDEQYFLSEKSMERLMSYKDNQFQPIPLQQGMKDSETGLTLLKVNSMHKKV